MRFMVQGYTFSVVNVATSIQYDFLWLPSTHGAIAGAFFISPHALLFVGLKFGFYPRRPSCSFVGHHSPSASELTKLLPDLHPSRIIIGSLFGLRARENGNVNFSVAVVVYGFNPPI